jgi:ribonuclease D
VAEIIEDQASLEAFLSSRQNGSGVAIDTEADSLHRYRESLCLIQFAHGEDCVVIDPLAIEDLTSLSDFLGTHDTWMHGADYDMTMLQREFSMVPPVVWDTQIGVRLLGMRKFGLADLVSHYFDVKLSKSSQKADWGRRPLSDEMIKYALNDVRYLLPMGDRIVSELKRLERYDWFVESCQAARTRVIERDDSREEPWRVRGAGKLDRLGLAFLKGLWRWRDKEAKSWDRPTFMVATNRDLLAWSTKLASGGKVDLPRHYRADRVKRFRGTVDEVRGLPQEEWPERPRGRRRKKNSAFDRRLDGLTSARDSKAASLDIDGSLIAPRSVLEQLAAEEAGPDEVLLNWQIQCLGLDA